MLDCLVKQLLLEQYNFALIKKRDSEYGKTKYNNNV